MMVTKVQSGVIDRDFVFPSMFLTSPTSRSGTISRFIVGDGEITVRKASKYDLAELVARIPRRYKTREVD